MLFDDILDRLEAEHIYQMESGVPLRSPIKQSFVLEKYPNDTPKRYANVLACALSTGEFGSKTIVIDDEKRTCMSRTLVYSSSGEPITNICSAHLTRIRCGFMAALCWRWYSRSDSLPRNVAIIGYGRIGKTVQRVLGSVFLSKMEPKWIIKQSRDDKLRSFDGQILEPPASLLQCDLLITATSEYERAFTLEAHSYFSPEALIVAFDSGFCLGPSFRRYTQYSDCPAALSLHAKSEFPWDGSVPEFFPLSGLKTARQASHKPLPSQAYIYGCAYADLIMALNAERLIEEFPSDL